MSVPFHSLHLNSQTREWSFHSFPFPPTSKQEKEENILKIFFFFSIPFYSFPSSQTECIILGYLLVKTRLNVNNPSFYILPTENNIVFCFFSLSLSFIVIVHVKYIRKFPLSHRSYFQ